MSLDEAIRLAQTDEFEAEGSTRKLVALGRFGV